MSRYTHGAWDRRRFVGAGITLTGAAAFAAACGGDKKEETKATTAPASGQGTSTAAGQATAVPAADARGGVFRTTSAQVYDSVDPHRAFGDPSSRTFNQTQSKMIWYKNPDTGEIEGDLAEKWEAPDAATYTFTLRPGVKWHNRAPANGREFVAEDVKWHIERQAGGKSKDGATNIDMRFGSFYKSITKIETPDKNTVKLTLASPNGSFLDRLAAYFSTIPNREAVEKYEGDQRTLNEEAIIGTGPYMATQFRAGKDVIYKRNPDYFRKDQPVTDGQIWTILFEDPNAQRAAFEQKQLDIWSSADASVTKAVLDAHKSEMYEILTGVGNTVYLHLNTQKQFKDNRLVRAMNMSIDRRGLIQTLHQGLGQVSGPVTWLQEGYALAPADLIKLEGFRTDRELERREARALWAAGGGPALGDVDIKIPRTWAARWPDTSQIIAKMFNDALGVTQFKSTPTDYDEEIIPNLFNGNFPNWFGWTSAVNSPDPRADLRNNFHSKGSTNFQKINNPQLDTLLDEAVALVDRQKAVEKVREIQRVILTENGGYGNVYLYNYINRSAAWNYYSHYLKEMPSAGKPGTGFALEATHLIAPLSRLNTKDATYNGRPPATV